MTTLSGSELVGSVAVCVCLSLWQPNVLFAQGLPIADGRKVDFVDYTETGEWKTWSDSRLTVRIPAGWHVAIDVGGLQKESRGLADYDSKWVYRLISKNAQKVPLSISVYRGGSEFVGCFCAPQKVYEHIRNDKFRIWALSLPDLEARMFKVASKTMRIDIHGRFKSEKNADRTRYIIESARPIEPSEAPHREKS